MSDNENSASEDDSAYTDTESSSDSEVSATDDVITNPTWSRLTNGLRRIPFTGNTGLRVGIPGNNTPIDWFNLLVDDVFLEGICRETNEYALQVFFKPSLTEKSRITRWKHLDVAELKTFLGLLLHTGTIRLNRLQDYWKTNRLFNLPVFREYMSRDRFLIILRCLHFSSARENNQETLGRLEKVNFIVDYFNNKMAQIYYPCKELSLDEAMVLWRGRLVFRQYIKGKRHKYGIKLYSLTEPFGLTLRFLIYSGKDGELAGKGHTYKVVLSLMRGKLGNGHALFMDNFYNSFILATKLLKEDTYSTGTLRADRKFNPADVKSAVLKKGETIARYAEGVMIGKWKDKRTVMYMSTQHENDMVTVLNKRKQEVQKPLPIVQYNAHMKGIDRCDQMMAYYPCERKTLRWYKKIFVHVLQMIVVNAMHLYNMHAIDKTMSLYDFRLSVIEGLLPPKHAPVPTPPRNALHKLVQNEERDKKGDRKRKECRVCYRTEKKRKMTTFTCSVCPGSPGLCAVNCFDSFHKDQQ